jgi:hypothetical protein
VADFELPRDQSGEVLPHDHPDLANERRLIRRITSDHIIFDDNLGCNRISSGLFKCNPKHGYLSIDSEHCNQNLQRDPAEYVTDPVFFGALMIDVGEFRSLDRAEKPEQRWKIGIVPMGGNDCHGAVWGKITGGQSNDMQRKSQWLVRVPGVTKLE